VGWGAAAAAPAPMSASTPRREGGSHWSSTPAPAGASTGAPAGTPAPASTPTSASSSTPTSTATHSSKEKEGERESEGKKATKSASLPSKERYFLEIYPRRTPIFRLAGV
jgi:hypothetical protein